ncbi:hypothetical protein [Phenylobacterium ferrooxidans]|uniref:DUF2188 domain-containing protein n=1 Tax=Phenylobacterium ferrooxidans TaxID=2982689 RepID=A0ABW6CQL1_9CAUL
MDQPIVSIAILRSPGGWRVISDGGSVRDYAYRVDAEEAALRFATAAGATGRPVEILLQQPGGELLRFTGSGATQ